MLAVNVTLGPNIYPQIDPPFQQRPISTYFHSPIKAKEKCSVITYRKSTTSFRLEPKSVTLNDPEPGICGLSAFFSRFKSALEQPVAVSYLLATLCPLTLVFDEIMVINMFARNHP